MKPKLLLALSVLIIVSILAVNRDWFSGFRSSRPAAAMGRMPSLTLNDLSGNPVALDQFAGKVLIVDFWATWCAPCREEIPHFQELYDGYRSQGLEILGLSVDDRVEDVRRYIEQEIPIRYRVLMATAEAQSLFGGIIGIPTTFVVGRDGTIHKKYVGYHPKEAFEKAVQELL